MLVTRRVTYEVMDNVAVIILNEPATLNPLSAGQEEELLAILATVREDSTVDNGISFWCVSDNLRKGAALNAIQIAEALVNRGLIEAKKKAA